MKTISPSQKENALIWAKSQLGACEIISDHSKEHGGHESATCRLYTDAGYCYLKIHQSPTHWHHEIHAYENWAHTFGHFAPKLLCVHDQPPLALIITELPGQVAENTTLIPEQERALWQSAGQALVALHTFATGTYLGSCLRDGTPASSPSTKPIQTQISNRLQTQIKKAQHQNLLTSDEHKTLNATLELTPAFEGEKTIPCHRDYCTANWLVHNGTWSGIIDFEFAYWDVCVADFSRDPHWHWIHRPDLIDAFFEGYGRPLTPQENQQLLVAHVEYALGAIVWGQAHEFYGFKKEGQDALAHLATLLR